MRIVAIALLSLPLAGCFGINMPPPPLPDWAMSPEAKSAVPTRAMVVRRLRRAPAETAKFSNVIPTSARQDDVLPFSAAWQAREDALDARMRRTMDICRGC